MLFVTNTSLISDAPSEVLPQVDLAADLRALHNASDYTYRPEHCTGGGAFNLVHPEDVSELVRLVVRQILQVLELQDVDALPDEEVDVDRVEAGPVVELLGRR